MNEGNDCDHGEMDTITSLTIKHIFGYELFCSILKSICYF